MRGTLFFKVLVISIVLSAVSMPARAEWVTIGLTAKVTSVIDDYSLLGGAISIGSEVQGIYTYNTSSSDSPAGSGGFWYYQAPAGIVLSAGGLSFQTDPANVRFVLGLSNGAAGSGVDYYSVLSYNNLAVANQVVVSSIGLELSDSSGKALSNLLLPPNAPNLGDWDVHSVLISGGKGGTAPFFSSTFYIGAEVLSLAVVPEPATFLLIAVGMFAVNRSRR